MENTQLSVYDRIKPYLILAKVTDYRRITAKTEDEKFQNEEWLRVILTTMLHSVSFNDIAKVNNEDYFDYFNSITQELKGIDLNEMDKIVESERIPMSKLVEKLNLNTLGQIKEQLEKAENEHRK